MLVPRRRGSLRALVACAVLGGASATTDIAAGSPSSRLVFAKGPNTEACPDESGLRTAVAARVGYDAFFPWATRTVVTRLDAVGGRYRARMEVLDEKGTLVGEKTFVSQGDDCEELVRTLALAVSLAIDVSEPATSIATPDRELPDESRETLPAPIAEVAPEPQRKEPDAQRRSTPSSLRGEGAASALASIGIAPSASIGVAAGVALRAERWSIGIECRYDPPSSTAIGSSANLSISLLAGSVVPCVRYGWLLGCGLATLGSLDASAQGVAQPGSDSALFLALGVRAGAEVEVASKLAFRATLDVATAPLSHTARIGVRDVHETSAWFGSLAASAVMRF